METAKTSNSFQHALKEIQGASQDSFSVAKSEAVKAANRAMTEMDQVVHRSPWYFIGGTVTAAALAGYLLGRRGRS
jgi:ElaB/YqjD/DUF883 family membrane-anchored ribosome-binding protein